MIVNIVDKEYTTHVNIICAMLFERGERQRNCVRTVTRRQVGNVVSKYNERERTTMTIREILQADTPRWAVSSTMQSDQFIVLMREAV